MNRLKKVLKNPYIFSVVSKVMIVAFGFVYSVCQARYLGTALKGDVAFVDSVTKITYILFGCGIHQAYPYFKKKTGENVAPLFLRLTLIMTGFYLLVAVGLAITIHSDIKLVAIFLLTPVLVYNRIVSYINMVETPNKKNLTELIVNIFELIAVIVLWIFFPATILWGLFLLFFKDLLLGIIYSYRLRKQFTTPVHLNKAIFLEIVKFGVFPMVALLMTTLNYRVDIIMLDHFVPNSEVGIYSVGVMLAERVWLIPDALKEVMISNLTKGKDYQEVGFVIRVCNSVCIFVVLGIIILGQPFINLFYGIEYADAYTITVIILVGVIFMIYYKMIGSYNIVRGKQKENLLRLALAVLTNIILNIILIPRFGNKGAAIASVFSYGVAAFLYIMYFRRLTGTKLTDMLMINREDIYRIRKMISKNKR